MCFGLECGGGGGGGGGGEEKEGEALGLGVVNGCKPVGFK